MAAMWRTKATEPTVMTNELLEMSALKTYCETSEARKIVDSEGFKFSDVEVLYLNFKNVLRITNLLDFDSLKKLQLCGNCVENIEGLEKLVNLVYLDLSFNNITEIHGLENLVKLEDLSLTNNKIKKVKNLDNLKNLQVLSLKNNLVDDYRSVQYLFTFKTLRSVAFQGCPIDSDQNYRLKIMAFVPSLLYFDYRLIDEEERDKAKEQYRFEIETLQEKAEQDENDKVVQALNAKKLSEYEKAFIEDLTESQFIDAGLSQHPSSKMLLEFPPLEELFLEFYTNFSGVCNDWVQASVKDLKQREKEEVLFNTTVDKTRSEKIKASREEVFIFSEFKENLLLKMSLLQQNSDATVQEFKTSIAIKISALWKKLMALEVPLNQELVDMSKMYYKELAGFVETAELTTHKFTSNLRNLEEQFLVTTTEFYSDFYSKSPEDKQQILKSSRISEINKPLFHLLQSDKSVVLDELGAGHKVRMSLIDKKEEVLISKLNFWMSETLSNFHEDELERHRKRLIEIHIYCERAKKEFAEAYGFYILTQLT